MGEVWIKYDPKGDGNAACGEEGYVGGMVSKQTPSKCHPIEGEV